MVWLLKFLGAIFLVLIFVSGWLSGLVIPRVGAQPESPDCAQLLSETVPAGSIAYPGEIFEKTWRVKNCGDSNWVRYRVVRVAGEFGQNSFAVPDTASGTENELSIMIQAPMSPGSYMMVYEMARPFNDMSRTVRFGDALVVNIRVARVIEVILEDETEIKIELEG